MLHESSKYNVTHVCISTSIIAVGAWVAKYCHTNLAKNNTQVDEGLIKHFSNTMAAFISNNDSYRSGVYKKA